MKILAIRFSAMGDTAMLSPVISEILTQNDNVEITILSQKKFQPFFKGIVNCKFKGIYLEDYKGLLGIFKLFLSLRKEKFDAIADTHNVLRTIILRFFFVLLFKKVSVIDKGRKEKKELLLTKKLTPLKTTQERYADVFRKLGLKVNLKNELVKSPRKSKYFKDDFKSKKNIGIAPFAKHKEKEYPIEKMKNVVIELAKTYNIFLFGGGDKENEILNNLQKGNDGIFFFRNVGLKKELELISNLDLMVSMDSANMHIASLKGIDVISIWGGTHHSTGFLGYGQKTKNIIDKKISCRPCSIFGNKNCFIEKKYDCLNILENIIIDKIHNFFSN